jgi:hypothetical protein
MDKRTELMTTTNIVKKLLEVNPQTRNSDSYLYLKVLGVIEEANNINVNHVPVKKFLTHMAEWGFPPFESVRRARQKLQNKHPELSADPEVQAFRDENEKAVWEYAVGAIR